MITDISEEEINKRLRKALITIEDRLGDDLSYLKALFYFTDEEHIKYFRAFLAIIIRQHEKTISSVETIRKERM